MYILILVCSIYLSSLPCCWPHQTAFHARRLLAVYFERSRQPLSCDWQSRRRRLTNILDPSVVLVHFFNLIFLWLDSFDYELDCWYGLFAIMWWFIDWGCQTVTCPTPNLDCPVCQASCRSRSILLWNQSVFRIRNLGMTASDGWLPLDGWGKLQDAIRESNRMSRATTSSCHGTKQTQR